MTVEYCDRASGSIGRSATITVEFSDSAAWAPNLDAITVKQ